VGAAAIERVGRAFARIAAVDRPEALRFHDVLALAEALEPPATHHV
jgi:hypothetical protein